MLNYQSRRSYLRKTLTIDYWLATRVSADSCEKAAQRHNSLCSSAIFRCEVFHVCLKNYLTEIQ
uniref:Uncharacterized protein n=1 Tax=Anguilla anguilla TaxID=7936 RepID=A0A0E9SG82_ANGAN